jgi:hypothetical protein
MTAVAGRMRLAEEAHSRAALSWTCHEESSPETAFPSERVKETVAAVVGSDWQRTTRLDGNSILWIDDRRPQSGAGILVRRLFQQDLVSCRWSALPLAVVTTYRGEIRRNRRCDFGYPRRATQIV